MLLNKQSGNINSPMENDFDLGSCRRYVATFSAEIFESLIFQFGISTAKKLAH